MKDKSSDDVSKNVSNKILKVNDDLKQRIKDVDNFLKGEIATMRADAVKTETRITQTLTHDILFAVEKSQ